MNEIDLSYLAGYLDGEGCFASTLCGRIKIICENTHRPTMEWINATVGGKLKKVPDSYKKKPHWKPSWNWFICDNEAADLCKQLVPFFHEKKEQAEILIQLQSTRIYAGKRAVPEEVKELRRVLAIRLRELKHVRYE